MVENWCLKQSTVVGSLSKDLRLGLVTRLLNRNSTALFPSGRREESMSGNHVR